MTDKIKYNFLKNTKYSKENSKITHNLLQKAIYRTNIEMKDFKSHQFIESTTNIYDLISLYRLRNYIFLFSMSNTKNKQKDKKS